MGDKAFSEKVTKEADRINNILVKKLRELSRAEPQVREKIRAETLEREIRRLEADLRDPVKAKLLKRKTTKQSDTVFRQSEARRINTRIKFLEKKIADMESKLADSDREQLLQQILEPLRREFISDSKIGSAKTMSADQIGETLAELFKFASNFEDFVLGVIAECEKSRARRRVLPDQDFRFNDLAKGFSQGEEKSEPHQISSHIKVLYTWLVQIITGYKSGAMSLYNDLWNSGLKEICDNIHEGNLSSLKTKKTEKILEALPPMRIEGQLQDVMSKIIMKK